MSVRGPMLCSAKTSVATRMPFGLAGRPADRMSPMIVSMISLGQMRHAGGRQLVAAPAEGSEHFRSCPAREGGSIGVIALRRKHSPKPAPKQ
jgi:hypothetical protein